MNLKTFKAAAVQNLANAHVTVQAYVSELEAAVKSNKVWLIVTAVICLLAGAYLGHLLPHK